MFCTLADVKPLNRGKIQPGLSDPDQRFYMVHHEQKCQVKFLSCLRFQPVPWE